MQIDLLKLKNNIVEEIKLNENLVFGEDLIGTTSILRMGDVHLEGIISKDMVGEYQVDFQIEGEMILSCAVTLKEVKYPFMIEITDQLQNLADEINENSEKVENTIDLLPIIWENILMEIPMRVVSEDTSSVKTEGDGWKFITEDEEEEIKNPAFENLKNLL